MGGLADRLVDGGYAFGWAGMRATPEPLARALFAGLADRVWRRRGRGVRQLERNLARVIGPDASEQRVRELSRSAMRSYFRYWVEAFQLPAFGREGVLRRVEVEGWAQVRAAVRERGAVVALPHMGNWDLVGAWAAHNQMPVTAVAEAVRPRSLFDRFVAYRRSIGIEVCAQGAPGLLDVLTRRASEHKVVALVADRGLGGNGVDVRFFGATARMPAGPAVVAARAGVPLFPVSLWYDGSLRVRVHEPVAAPCQGTERARAEAVTQRLAECFEQAITRHPQDWHMLQRVWVADRAERRAGGAG